MTFSFKSHISMKHSSGFLNFPESDEVIVLESEILRLNDKQCGFFSCILILF